MINWGIIGAGNIAHRFAKSLQNEQDAVLYAISGRNEEKLTAFQNEYPCEKVYVGHGRLLEDKTIEAVYVALPHAMHAEWVIKALKAHKAVLVEKPAGINVKEVRKMVSVSENEQVLFMEAMKERFTPGYRKIKELIMKGIIGEVTSVKADDGFLVPEERFLNSYYSSSESGGVLLDSGCYGISWILEYLKGEPVISSCQFQLKNGVDVYSDTILSFGEKTGELTAAFDRNLGWNVMIYGTKGRIEVKDMHRPKDFTVYVNGEDLKEYHVPYVVDDFFGEVHEFDTLLKEGKIESEIMSHEDSIQAAVLMDLIRSRFTGN